MSTFHELKLSAETKKEITKQWFESNKSIERIAEDLNLSFAQVLHAVNEARLSTMRVRKPLIDDDLIPFDEPRKANQ